MICCSRTTRWRAARWRPWRRSMPSPACRRFSTTSTPGSAPPGCTRSAVRSAPSNARRSCRPTRGNGLSAPASGGCPDSTTYDINAFGAQRGTGSNNSGGGGWRLFGRCGRFQRRWRWRDLLRAAEARARFPAQPSRTLAAGPCRPRRRQGGRYGHLVRQHVPQARLLYGVASLHHLRVARQAEAQDEHALLASSRRLRAMERAAAAAVEVHCIPWSPTPQAWR